MRTKSLIALFLTLGVLAASAPAFASPRDAGLQVALKSRGFYLGPIDGDIGPVTHAAVVAAQQKAHLPATGAITTRVRDSLGPLGRPLLGKRPIAPGEMGLDVSTLQYLLAHAGFFHGALDGYMGVKLEAAVRAYQQQAQLPVDGIAGPITLAHLVKRARTHPAPRATQTYVVAPGDSLTAIAAHFEVSLRTLATSNDLDPAKALLIGTHLTVPLRVAHAALVATPTDVPALLDTWSAKLGVSDHLVRALAWMESGYQPDVVSDVGAQGVMQVMPTTRSFVEEVLVGHPIPRSPDGDIEVGVLYLRHLLAQFNGDTTLALAAWYQGEAAVREYGLYQMTKPFVTDVLALQARM